MSMTLQIQILIYIIIIAFMTGLYGYSKGFRDGKSLGYEKGRNIGRHPALRDRESYNG
jgi:hypothetical protein